jgi:outer membrane lipoprotein SlyB
MNYKNLLKKIGTPVLSVAAAILLTGCAGSSFSKVGTSMSGEKVQITKKDVHAKTKMSETVFLEPVSPEEQIIFFRFRNTSDEELNVNDKLKSAFEKKGFVVTTNPKKANFLVQANLLKVGEMNLNEQKNYLGAGFAGGAALGAATALTGGGYGRSGKAAVAGAVIGMLWEAAKVKDVHYAMVTDIEIRQRPLDGETVTQSDNLQGKMGATGNSTQIATNNNVQWKKYRTRIVSSAYAPGLDFAQAQPFLEKGMVRALAGTM